MDRIQLPTVGHTAVGGAARRQRGWSGVSEEVRRQPVRLEGGGGHGSCWLYESLEELSLLLSDMGVARGFWKEYSSCLFDNRPAEKG